MGDKKLKLLTKNKKVRDQYIVLINNYKVNKQALNYVTYLKLHNQIVKRMKAVQLEELNDYLYMMYPAYFGGN